MLRLSVFAWVLAALVLTGVVACGPVPPPWWGQEAEGGAPPRVTEVHGTEPAEVCSPKPEQGCPDGCEFGLNAGASPWDPHLFVATDCADNTVVAGDVVGEVDFGGGSLSNPVLADSTDLFVAKLGPDGKHVWSGRFGDHKNQTLFGFALDAQGATYLSGAFDGDLDFGPGPIEAEGNSLFAAKLDAAGQLVWARAVHLGEEGSVTTASIAAGANGAVWIAATVRGVPEVVKGQPFVGSEPWLLVLRLDAEGAEIGARAYGPGFVENLALTPDHEGNVWLSGSLHGEIDFGKGALSSNDQWGGALLLKLSPEGDPITQRLLENGAFDFHLVVDSEGSAVIAGTAYWPMDFGGGEIGSVDHNLFAVKYDANGTYLWGRAVSGLTLESGGLSLDPEDHPVIMGAVSGIASLDGVHIGSPGYDRYLFLLELDPAGTAVKASSFHMPSSTTVFGVSAPSAHAATFVGTARGTATFGDVEIAGGAGEDAFFVASIPR